MYCVPASASVWETRTCKLLRSSITCFVDSLGILQARLSRPADLSTPISGTKKVFLARTARSTNEAAGKSFSVESSPAEQIFSQLVTARVLASSGARASRGELKEEKFIVFTFLVPSHEPCAFQCQIFLSLPLENVHAEVASASIALQKFRFLLE
jgi:hypothetical protein